MKRREYFWEFLRTEEGILRVSELKYYKNCSRKVILEDINRCRVGCPQGYGFNGNCECVGNGEYAPCEECYRLSYRDTENDY